MAPHADAAPHACETVIFVDVDGVLNVGIRDKDDAPLLLNASNMDYATSQIGKRLPRSAEADCIEKLLSVCARQIAQGTDKATYRELACAKNSHISQVLAGRLAKIIMAAGEKASVVLSSNWRKPCHASRVRRLEVDVSKHLGYDFAFDARTRPADERCAADRLRCIGDYLESAWEPVDKRTARPLRVLVLEDFFISPIDGWMCGNSKMVSNSDVEAYLRKRAIGLDRRVAVKLVHTYDEWTTVGGLRTQVGCGLTVGHQNQAVSFLAGSLAQPKSTGAKFLPLVPLPNNPTHDFDSMRRDLEAVMPPLDKGMAASLASKNAASAALADPRWADYVSAAWPWLSMYLPCAA